MNIARAHQFAQAASDAIKEVDADTWSSREDRLMLEYARELLEKAERVIFTLGNKTEPSG